MYREWASAFIYRPALGLSHFVSNDRFEKLVLSDDVTFGIDLNIRTGGRNSLLFQISTTRKVLRFIICSGNDGNATFAFIWDTDNPQGLYVKVQYMPNSDRAAYDGADRVAKINDAASLISDITIKQNGKTVYDNNRLYMTPNVKSLI